MPPSDKARSPAATSQLPPSVMARLLRHARQLQHAAQAGPVSRLLQGKRIGLLCDAAPDEAQLLFRSAAEELGADVAVLRPHLAPTSTAREVLGIARLLGSLYDAVECHTLDPALAQHVGQLAGIPVFDAVAAQGQVADRLAEILGSTASLADCRRFLCQAMLLDALA